MTPQINHTAVAGLETIQPDVIKDLDDKLFNRVWEFIKSCDDREKHFNDLQNRYRVLASTWFLATFAGMGFALTTTLQGAIPRDGILSVIATAGIVGLTMLWVVDVLVYHDLLILSHTTG